MVNEWRYAKAIAGGADEWQKVHPTKQDEILPVFSSPFCLIGWTIKRRG